MTKMLSMLMPTVLSMLPLRTPSTLMLTMLSVLTTTMLVDDDNDVGGTDNNDMLKSLKHEELLAWVIVHCNIEQQVVSHVKKQGKSRNTSILSFTNCASDLVQAIAAAPKSKQPTKEDLVNIISKVSLIAVFPMILILFPVQI